MLLASTMAVQLYKYFPFLSSRYHKLLLTDEEGQYSITTPKSATIISEMIKQYFGHDNLIITDATSGIGGNVISFSSYFYHVNAIELNSERYQYLVNNMTLYNRENILCYNIGFEPLVHTIKQDVIFMDPPWGGKNYKDVETMTIEMDDEKLEDICLRIINANICEMLILKLPLNYDMTEFNELSSKASVHVIMMDIDLPKMKIIYFCNGKGNTDIPLLKQRHNKQINITIDKTLPITDVSGNEMANADDVESKLCYSESIDTEHNKLLIHSHNS
jgi:16S rRNA G966 N2-methylase RsmD